MKRLSTQEKQLIRDSGLFDPGWYCEQYPDVAISGIDPLEHYLEVGTYLDRKPNPLFDPVWYLESNDDLSNITIDPLVHFIRREMKEKHQLIAGGMTNIYRGAFNSISAESNVSGWAFTGNHGVSGAQVSLYVNNQKLADIACNIYRKDLHEKNINNGYAGFNYSMPIQFINGKEYTLEIRDSTGEFILCTCMRSFNIQRNFSDYDGFLVWSFFHREVPQPFREEDKRCFAYMDWLEKFNFKKHAEKFKLIESQPLVSIIMPSYNRGYIISRAIKSITSQSYENWELLIIDDGSNDDTEYRVSKDFDDPRIKYRKTKQRGGVSLARNIGLDIAQGKYISYLDSDNDWRNNYLMMMVGGLESRPEFDCAYTGQYLYEDEGKPKAVRFGPFNRTLLENRNYIDLNAFMHKKSLAIRKGGFDTKMRRLVDWDLILRYTEDKKPLVVENILSNYYYNQSSDAITMSEDYGVALQAIYNNQMMGRDSFQMKFNSIGYIHDAGQSSAILSSASNRLKQELGASIIIVSYNIPLILKACVESILETTDDGITDIIIIDNCSNNETVTLVKKLGLIDNVSVIFNKKNLGFTAAVNQGILLSDPEKNIVLLNNDSITTRGWLAELEQETIRDESVGIVAPQQVLLSETKTINTHAPYANKHHETDVTVSAHHKNLMINKLNDASCSLEINFVPFFCVYITRESINKIGLLDAELGRHYRSDRLYCYAVRYQARKKIIFTPKSKVYHLHQQSTKDLKKKDDKEFSLMFVKNTWSENDFSIPWDK